MAKTTKPTAEASVNVSVEEKLKALYNLQCVDSEIDKIRIVRGELPMEIQDLEDEISGLQTRIEKLNADFASMDENLANSKEKKKEAQSIIAKYEDQIAKIKNNREYESLSKEIEFQKLEIELAEKKEKEYKEGKLLKQEVIDSTTAMLTEKNKELDLKQGELEEIIKETEKEESDFHDKSKQLQSVIEDRLLIAYKRIRSNVRNKLAVVSVSRDACGGCFNKIPPQRQLDIRMHKKVIVCEHCGRILVDAEMFEN